MIRSTRGLTSFRGLQSHRGLQAAMFDPAKLFLPGDKGVFFVQNQATMWSDFARTTPTVREGGDPSGLVAVIDNMVATGGTLEAPDSAARPELVSGWVNHVNINARIRAYIGASVEKEVTILLFSERGAVVEQAQTIAGVIEINAYPLSSNVFGLIVIDRTLSLQEVSLVESYMESQGWVPPAVEGVPSTPNFISWVSGFAPEFRKGFWYANGDIDALDTASNDPLKEEVWVDKKLGDNSNDGSKNAPFATVRYALEYALTNQSTLSSLVINVESGVYTRLESWDTATSNQPSTVNVTIKGSGDVYLTKAFEPQVWSAHSGAIWKTTRSAVGRIIDMSKIEGNGYWSLLENVGSDPSSIVSGGQYATDGSTVYVRTFDDREPDDSLLLEVNSQNFIANNWSADLFIQNVNFVFGNNAFEARGSSGLEQYKATFYQCGFLFGFENGLRTAGCGELYALECTSAMNRFDGFNWHQSQDGLLSGNVLEASCISEYNGYSGGSSNNASSCHDAGMIVRIGGYYAHCTEGPLVPDVNSCKSWAVGCTVSQGNTHGFLIEGAAGQMQLDYCYANDVNGSPAVAVSGATLTNNNGKGQL